MAKQRDDEHVVELAKEFYLREANDRTLMAEGIELAEVAARCFAKAEAFCAYVQARKTEKS